MSYPLAQVYPEYILEFERLLANASIYCQTQLMIARLDNELKRFSILNIIVRKCEFQTLYSLTYRSYQNLESKEPWFYVPSRGLLRDLGRPEMR